MRVTPCASMSAAVTWVTGLLDSRLADLMREPVTTTVSSSAAPAESCAWANGATTAVEIAPNINARRTASATVLVELIKSLLMADDPPDG